LSTPVGFAKGILGVSLYPWQERILAQTHDVFGRTKITVAAPNGSGKSERVIPCAALRWISITPKGRVVITSKDGKQINNQVMPGLQKHRGKFLDFTWKHRDIESPAGGKITAFTTDEAGRMEGWHCDLPDSPLMIIVDEAKSVPEDIFQAIDRCTFNVLLLISSTGLDQGRFWESHFASEGWLRHKITIDDCPHADKERISDIIQEYGPDHPFPRSTFYSEFMSVDDGFGFFVTSSDIHQSMLSPPYRRQGDTVAFCDFAGGGDENVLAIRRGNEVRIVRAWKESDEARAIGTFIRLFRENELKQDQIWGDNGGAGKPMIAVLDSLGWTINRFNGGAPVKNNQDFTDENARVWEMAGREIKKGNIILPDDPILHRQMITRKRLYTMDGRIQAESKEKMRERHVKSPDRADAVMGCIALKPMVAFQTKNSMFQTHDFEEDGDPNDYIQQLSELAGV
jgi:hypothetical protein